MMSSFSDGAEEIMLNLPTMSMKRDFEELGRQGVLEPLAQQEEAIARAEGVEDKAPQELDNDDRC